MRFFDKHKLFLESSPVGNWPDRLNARYEAIIASNHALFREARVLDIASHDGRWSFAALEAGAAHVVGVEARADLVSSAESNLRRLGVSSNRYQFVAGDVFERRDLFTPKFDVILCLGFFYHTARHIELLHLIRSTNARTVILDTLLLNRGGVYAEMVSEAAENPANGTDQIGVRDGQILVSVPTAGAVDLMLRHFGYDVQHFDWGNLINVMNLRSDLGRMQSADNPVGDYARQERGTFLATLPVS